MWELLDRAWEHPIAVSSNIAREFALEVAFAASMGWLSNLQPSGTSYTRAWHITAEGELALRTRKEVPIPKTEPS